ncbi:MAG TPA: NAD(P)-binding protein [Terriglobia bacterium]|nr:NAD(P)-binding protein [Terriglobia bacterium]
MKGKDGQSSKSLGLTPGICRRDFLNGTLLAAGGALLCPFSPAEILAQRPAWGGYTGEGDYRDSNGNPEDVMLAGHSVRDGSFDKLPADTIDTGERFDCVVVGGGISGLAAALYFQDQAIGSGRTCLVIENHPIFGGEAKRNEFIVDGQRLMAPQGSNLWVAPLGDGMIAQFYDRIGFDWKSVRYQTWAGPDPEVPLSKCSYTKWLTTPATFGFYFGAKFGQQPGIWIRDFWNRLDAAPLPEAIRADLRKWRSNPRHETSIGYAGDEESRRLDSMTAEDRLVEDYGISREMIRMFVANRYAQALGLGPDAVSAYCDYANIMRVEEGEWQSFPGGVAGIGRHLVKTLIPRAISGPPTLEGVCRGRVNWDALDHPHNLVRIRLNSTAVRVEHNTEPSRSDFVWVAYTQGGKTYRLKAQTVIMAGGIWITSHVVRDLPSTHREACTQFHRSACLVANVAVRNWRFLYKLGVSGGQWFEGLGSWTEVRKIATFGSEVKTIGPDSPTVLSLYAPYFYPGLSTRDQGVKGRMEMLSTPFADYEHMIRQEFTAMFARSGFDTKRDIAGIILNRWGHAFLNPAPGFFFGTAGKPSPRAVLRNAPFGRIAFANTELFGRMDHTFAVAEGHRAAYQVWPLVS